jgi:hypothetical protein
MIAVDILTLPAVIVIFLSAAVLIISWAWRPSIFSLAVQYAGVFILVLVSWPLETAAVKLVAGWIACAVLALAMNTLPTDTNSARHIESSDIIFRIIISILAGLFVFTGGLKIVEWFPMVSVEQAYGGLTLITLGLIHLGLTTQPFRVVIGLLTVLSGFEIIYAAAESSILITGLLALITLGLSVIGSYLLAAPMMEEIS